ncbi:MAG: hypothetical protein ACLFQB_04465 [Chitinispirillaceae bacterium]
MSKKFALAMGFVVVFIGFVRAEGDMSLTLESGEEVLLYEDSTWSYAEEKTFIEEQRDDIYITLSDDRVVWLKSDNTWTITDSQPESNKPDAYPSLAVVGKATQNSLDHAVKLATRNAYRQAAKKLRKFAPAKAKDVDKYIKACIKREIGENGVEIAYKPKWKAEAKISLTSLQVKDIVECVEAQY